jgi:glycosyltransferase involved in cell wall biosynthesis
LPLFSVIVPLYNVAEFVETTIQSILVQSFADYEVLLIDDGSTDNTLNIIKRYESLDYRIRVFSKSNGGVSSARNLGIKESTGEYILFLDGDDFINEALLQIASDLFTFKKIDMFSYGYLTTVGNKVLREYANPRFNNKLFTGKEFIHLYLLKKISQCMCSFIVSRKVVVEHEILFDENTKYAEDQEFQLKCIKNCSNILYESNIYFHYIQRNGSAINKVFIRDDFDVYFRIQDYLKRDEEVLRDYKTYLIYTFIYSFMEVMKKGSDQETVKKLLYLDFVLKDYIFHWDKNSLKSLGFIVLYKLFLKQVIINKFKLT